MTKLVAIAAPESESAMETLEPVLKAISEGRVSALACAVVYRDGTPDWAISHLPSISTMLGTIDRMHFAILQDTLA